MNPHPRSRPSPVLQPSIRRTGRNAFRTTLHPALLLGMAATLAPSARAQTLSLEATAIVSSVFPSRQAHQTLGQAGTLDVALGPLSDPANSNAGSASGSAWAQAGPGTLRAQVATAAQAPGADPWWVTHQGDGGASTLLGYADTITFQIPGFAGQHGTAVAHFTVTDVAVDSALTLANFAFSAILDSRGSVNLSVGVGPAQGAGLGFGEISQTAQDPSGAWYVKTWQTGASLPATIQVPFSFAVGSPVQISMGLDVRADAFVQAALGNPQDYDSNHGSASASASLYWVGLSDVRVGDQLVDGGSYSALGGSGVDYTQSYLPGGVVPEPATYGVVVGLGLLALGTARRRGRTA